MAKGRLETLSLRLVIDDGDELGLVACDCTARLLATNLQRHGAQRRTETQSQTSSMVEHRGGHIARIPNMVFSNCLFLINVFYRKNDARSLESILAGRNVFWQPLGLSVQPTRLLLQSTELLFQPTDTLCQPTDMLS